MSSGVVGNASAAMLPQWAAFVNVELPTIHSGFSMTGV
jgi:hypothetical protein